MGLFAILDNGATGTVTNVAVADQAHATAMGWVGPLDSLSPQPGIGWSYNGATWTAPTPPPPTAAETALVTLQTMLAQQGALQTQLEADIASVTGTGWANLTAAEQQAIIGRILSDGLGSAMQAIVAHLTVDGIT